MITLSATPTLLKVSRQGQLTLTRPVLQALGNPRHLQAEVRPDRTLLLRPALKMTLDEAAAAFAAEGITAEVLTEALRILNRREKAARELRRYCWRRFSLSHAASAVFCGWA